MKNRAPLTIIDNYAFFLRQWPSNWEIAPMDICGTNYNCVEQWMMAEKARVHNDYVTRNKILATQSQFEQKQLGRTVKNYCDELWSAYRVGIVLHGTLEKYRQNKELRKFLFDTEDLFFVEANPRDRIWGNGYSEKDMKSGPLDPWSWGQNLLGKVLNTARIVLKKEFENDRE